VKIENFIEEKEWGFEVWEVGTDKGKQVFRRQRGAAVCGNDPKDIMRAVELMRPFSTNSDSEEK
jgi:hypothetical protein